MIDMGAVLGGRATVGKTAESWGPARFWPGVIEPASATPVVIEDDVLVGANAVILEGSGWAAGLWWPPERWSLPTSPETVVAGVPARVIKAKDEKAAGKTALVEALREL